MKRTSEYSSNNNNIYRQSRKERVRPFSLIFSLVSESESFESSKLKRKRKTKIVTTSVRKFRGNDKFAINSGVGKRASGAKWERWG